MVRLTKEQLKDKLTFIDNYINASNAADGSTVDANANVIKKDIATLEAELYKAETIQINREIIKRKLTELFGEDMGKAYLEDIKQHFIYIHDETSLKPYCASVSLYPFISKGTKPLGGGTVAPKNLRSFCGSFINLMYLLASNFAGAVATVEFLMYFDYFARKTYGTYYLETHYDEVIQELQGVVYSMNQPASARGNQSVFWNISVFDKYYFESLFGDFVFPDGTRPEYLSVKALQEEFMLWFTRERTKELLTFPVVTAAMLTSKGRNYPDDVEFANNVAYWTSLGLGFFKYQSPTVDSLSSCCRLRNELADNDFSYTLGAGGVATGSKQVITLNINRIFQEHLRPTCSAKDKFTSIILRVYKYLIAHNEVVKDNIKAGLLPAYTAGFIHEDRQFLTIGVNGLLEAYESTRSELAYPVFVENVLTNIKNLNKMAASKWDVKFNTEFVPAENLGVKNAKWDKEDGYIAPRDCYNSYLFPVEDSSWTILDKIKVHGRDIADCLDGGAALHLNLEQLLSYEQACKLISLCSIYGVPFWDVNIKTTICNECGCIDPRTLQACPKCGSKDLDYATRIIGYLKRISNFASERQKEAHKRFYAKSADLNTQEEKE